MVTELVSGVENLGAIHSMFLTLFPMTSYSLVIQQGPVSILVRQSWELRQWGLEVT